MKETNEDGKGKQSTVWIKGEGKKKEAIFDNDTSLTWCLLKKKRTWEQEISLKVLQIIFFFLFLHVNF